ncbi:unnamed protein product [Hydatigera taeniaeformis]|uniref:Sulfate_transp domain-containing protein n=1 Tax=Hydatigena taeniaeformis TaxID=6205 RepID=A0A0R3WVE8_HYDTA|nr:unnamed protein product [Hydatigera taeniaeformis]
MARGVALLFGALLFKFVGLVLVYGVPVPTGVMLPSIMVGFSLLRIYAPNILGLRLRDTTSTSHFLHFPEGRVAFFLGNLMIDCGLLIAC